MAMNRRVDYEALAAWLVGVLYSVAVAALFASAMWKAVALEELESRMWYTTLWALVGAMSGAFFVFVALLTWDRFTEHVFPSSAKGAE